MTSYALDGKFIDRRLGLRTIDNVTSPRVRHNKSNALMPRDGRVMWWYESLRGFFLEILIQDNTFEESSEVKDVPVPWMSNVLRRFRLCQHGHPFVISRTIKCVGVRMRTASPTFVREGTFSLGSSDSSGSSPPDDTDAWSRLNICSAEHLRL